MEITIESVTPDKATKWLNLNKSNRKLKTQNAIRYFMQGKKLTIIKGTADEAYPLKKVRKPRIAVVA